MQGRAVVTRGASADVEERVVGHDRGSDPRGPQLVQHRVPIPHARLPAAPSPTPHLLSFHNLTTRPHSLFLVLSQPAYPTPRRAGISLGCHARRHNTKRIECAIPVQKHPHCEMERPGR
eukprot:3869574-Rhodomonas_salina.1